MSRDTPPQLVRALSASRADEPRIEHRRDGCYWHGTLVEEDPTMWASPRDPEHLLTAMEIARLEVRRANLWPTKYLMSKAAYTMLRDWMQRYSAVCL